MHFVESYLSDLWNAGTFSSSSIRNLLARRCRESALIASSLLALHGTLHIQTVLITVFIASVLGDSTGYLIGRFGGRKLILRYGYLVKPTPGS